MAGKLITVAELREAVEEAKKMGIPPSRVNVVFLDDKATLSHPEEPGRTFPGLAYGEVIQTMKYDGCNVQTQRTRTQQYL